MMKQSSENIIDKYGIELLNDPILNKGTAFTPEERKLFGLNGLLPTQVVDLETQSRLVLENIRRKANPLEKSIYLTELHNCNETLYFKVLSDNLKELTPLVYTPTVGLVCQKYSEIFQRPRGLYLSKNQKGEFYDILRGCPRDDIRIIVVTDGSRILGLGDLGANGMGIPIGKLALYTACGGIAPEQTLPVVIDVGTNNKDLLDDPLYIGARSERINGTEYDELIDEFVEAVKKRWPDALIQFEDFTNDHAFPILEKYRNEVLCFNDDIQGTGSVSLSGLFGALRITGEELKDQKIVFFGAGAAGIGIADTIVNAIVEESGISEEKAREMFWFLDSKGLVTTQREGKLSSHKVPYARDEKYLPDLLSVVAEVKPTVLMGLSGRGQSFTQEVVQEMAKYVEKPIIFALSNPTSKAECSAEQAYTWTDGKAIYASGSPFDPVNYKGKVLVPGQCNNMYIFPGVGLGASLCGARRVTDSMFNIAAKTLAELVSGENLEKSNVFPEIEQIREISEKIASAVCRHACKLGLATFDEPSDIQQFFRDRMYIPEYKQYTRP